MATACFPFTRLMPTVAMNVAYGESRILAGEMLSAKILLDSTDPDTIVSNFIAEISGFCKTGWVNIHTDKIFETEKEYFKVQIVLFPSNKILPCGRHQFPVRYRIPESLPSSFESQYGAVRYSIRVQLNTNSAQIMDTSISVFNRSRKALSNCSVQLVLKAQFEAMSRYEHVNEKRLSENVVEQCELGKVKARCNTSFDNCQLRIPESAPPSQSGIIALSYVYRFLAFPGIELEIPLVVTAMAYRSGHGQQTQYVDNADSSLEHDPGSIVYLC